jgi:hypothetical protein
MSDYLNELEGRRRMTDALAHAGRGLDANDPKVMQVIRDAEAQRRWDADHEFLTTAELARHMHLPLIAEAARDRMVALGLRGLGLRMLPGKHRERDNAEVVYRRVQFEEWFATFDAVAGALGYTRNAPSAATVAARVGGAAVVAVLMMLGLLG